MRKSFFPTVVLLATALFVGCTAPKTLVINTQKPAQVALPGTINNVIVVNNLVVQPEHVGNTIQKYDNKGNIIFDEVSVKTDSLGIIFAGTLYDNLAEKNYFKEVSIYDTPLRDDLAYMDIRPIDSLNAKEICDISNSDVIISLDKFHVATNLKNDLAEFGVTAQYLDAKMSASFSIYSKKGTLISNSLNLVDSIYWTAIYSGKHLISQDSLPTREDALKEAARYAGEKIAAAFVPYWEEVPRLYYNENKEAIKLAENDDWASALKIWETAYEQEPNDKKKARLAFNIALANELTDNLRDAAKWIAVASELFKQSAQTSIDQQNYLRSEEYKKELLTRFNDFKLLDVTKMAED